MNFCQCGAELTFLDGDLGRTECEDCLHVKSLDAAIAAVTDIQSKLDMSADKHYGCRWQLVGYGGGVLRTQHIPGPNCPEREKR